MKQSSIEWLFQKLWDTPKDKLTWYSILNEAKAMHKQEIMDVYSKALVHALTNRKMVDCNKYYKETFEDNK